MASAVVTPPLGYTPVPMVFVETPYSQNNATSRESEEEALLRNQRYLVWARADAAARGELPVDSHGGMTRHPMCAAFWCSDYDEKYIMLTRGTAIAAAMTLRHKCDETVLYTDRGVSRGMGHAKKYCADNNVPLYCREVNVDRILQAFPQFRKNFFRPHDMFNAVVGEGPYKHLFPNRSTLAIVKPDAATLEGLLAIDRCIERMSMVLNLPRLCVVRAAKVHLTKAQAAAFYAEHSGKPFFSGLVDHMASGPVLVLQLTSTEDGVPAFSTWRRICGPTDPKVAREGFTTTTMPIRAVVGTTLPRNAVHGSDSVESAQRELAFFFGKGGVAEASCTHNKWTDEPVYKFSNV